MEILTLFVWFSVFNMLLGAYICSMPDHARAKKILALILLCQCGGSGIVVYNLQKILSSIGG